ncbi:aminoglycoside phosphotransferase family protein [Ureibacillus aquaedulcis]|uniref:Aminoglycoside phosphotransferase family protein n=1 Tax=Ureibacillus aquaedulcis TaxID=3058421 RepID=A0ABT8GMA7_9BACL|nr:aminoglycoside phosphotransferase family protein [Ureibacillus sp. BA0131]MDN4492560.1 aminoglycoside phosphotransferase family protein [Ureibacillus sp. BA0131]
MNDKLNEVVEQTIGPIKKITLLDEQGWTSEVCRITTSEGSFLLKTSYIERYRSWLKCEAETLKKLNRIEGFSVPIYFGFFEEEKKSHLLMSFEDGITLTKALKLAKSDNDKLTLIKSFGQFLQNFHEKEPLKILRHEEDWLEYQLLRAQHYFEKGQTDGNASLELLINLMSNRPKTVKQTMIHGDCTTDNVFVINGKVQLFIDVGAMTIGDPRYDEALAIRKFKNNPEYLGAFYEGYTRYRVNNAEIQYFEEGLYEFF